MYFFGNRMNMEDVRCVVQGFLFDSLKRLKLQDSNISPRSLMPSLWSTRC